MPWSVLQERVLNEEKVAETQMKRSKRRSDSFVLLATNYCCGSKKWST